MDKIRQFRKTKTTPDKATNPKEYAILLKIVHLVRYLGPTSSIAAKQGDQM